MSRILVSCTVTALALVSLAWPQTGSPPSAEDERDRRAAASFQAALERNPRRGTALDRLYGYHIERGSLDQLLQQYHQRTAKDPADGAAWMILGLLEAQRGKDSAALAAFRQAEQHRPQDTLASFYLGQTLVLVGQPAQAAAAFERALDRKPANRTDLLAVFEALGRVYQRANQPEKALETWQRLEQLFPNDPRVLEQIATTLAEEGQLEAALARYGRLIEQTKKQPDRQTALHLEAADLKVRLNRRSQALTELEFLLARLNPDSYYARETRRQIEEIFRRNEDLGGLAKYYETWIAKNPDDVEAMERLARVLTEQARAADAQAWLDRAIERNPSRKSLRLALIEQLVAAKKFAQAAAQYELLNKQEPNNPDILREWGKCLLQDLSQPEAERQKQAVAVWRRLLEVRSRDPRAAAAAAVRVAELMRQAELTDEAIALYRRAIELAPDAPEFAEYLGEYYHSLKRPDDALATWRQSVAGGQRNAKKLARLAEVLAGFGYLVEATAAFGDACSLAPEDFNVHLKYAEVLFQGAKYEEALKQLAAATGLARQAEQREAVLALELRIHREAGNLDAALAQRRKEVEAAPDQAQLWYRLAQYHETAQQTREAVTAIRKALDLDPRAVPVSAAAARLYEKAGNLLEAGSAHRRLATLDRPNRTEHLSALARLEVRLGRADQALEVGREVIAASPGNAEQYRFYADLCFQTGAAEEGLEALRRGVRANPADIDGLLALGGALAERFRTGEAIELYWRAFDRTDRRRSLDDQLALVSRLTVLHLRTNQLDLLLERLRRGGQNPEGRREHAMCLAQAYQAAGDLGSARQELDRLLPDNPRDTQLLYRLSVLAESDRDLTAAVQYQRQLVRLSPSKETEARLAGLLTGVGEADEAGAIYVRLAQAEKEPVRILQASDWLLAIGKHEAALALLGRMLREQPRNWEGLYREGVTLATLSRPAEAERRFRAILELRLGDDDLSALQLGAKKKPTPRGTGRTTPNAPQEFPIKDRLHSADKIRLVSGLQFTAPDGTSASGFWSPADFGQARMAALGWLLSLAQKQQRTHDFLQQARQVRNQNARDQRALWDWFYLQYIRDDRKQTKETARLLSKQGSLEAQWIYLRAFDPGPPPTHATAAPLREPNALPADELDHLLACFWALQRQRPEWDLSPGVFVRLSTELKRAGRKDDEEKFYHQLITSAHQPEPIRAALEVAFERGDVAAYRELFDKWDAVTQRGAKAGVFPSREDADLVSRSMDSRGEAKAYADLNSVLDHFLVRLGRRYQAAPLGFQTNVLATPRVVGSINYFVGSYSKNFNLDYPALNDYFNYNAVITLGDAFMLFDRDDLVTDLIAHLRAGLKTPGPGQVHRWLALVYVLWWNHDPEEATRAMVQAIEAIPGDPNLRLEFAKLYEKRNLLEEAETIVEAVVAADQAILQRREAIALRLAQRTNHLERAQLAATRLFGLRLDPLSQTQLAAAMEQLGMPQMAEAVLARTRRHTSNRLSTLVSLMRHYQDQNKPAIATQIAFQILRSSSSSSSSGASSRRIRLVSSTGQITYAYSDEFYREQAMQVLAASGKLTAMIARTEAQLKNSPRSVQLHQTVATYYRAANNPRKAREVIENLARLHPEDARLHFEIARQLAAAGEQTAAIDLYLRAFRKEPALLANMRSYNLIDLFHRAHKLDALVDLLDGIDLKQLGSTAPITNLFYRLLNDAKGRERAYRLFRKTWEAFPAEHSRLVQSLSYYPDVWRMPGMFDYACQALIPTDADDTLADPWRGMDYSLSSNSDGTVETVVTHVVQIAAAQNQMDLLTRRVDQAVQKFPSWKVGRALQAILAVRNGRAASARPIVEEVLADRRSPAPPTLLRVLGQETEKVEGMLDLAMRAYEEALARGSNLGFGGFRYGPGGRLLSLYQRTGRRNEGRALIQKLLAEDEKNQRPATSSDTAREQVGSRLNLAGQMLQFEFPLDALRVYQGLLMEADLLELASGAGGRENFPQQVWHGLAQCLNTMSARGSPDDFREWLTPRTGGRATDLGLLVHPREWHQARLISPLVLALTAAAATPKGQEAVNSLLAQYAKQAEHDLTPSLVATLLALTKSRGDQSEEKIAALVRRLEEVPLEKLPTGARANSRQRAEAIPQVALWLVARECLREDKLRPAGERLAARALEAARRQVDPSFALAILREWGQIQFTRGDRPAAERFWTQMLELILPSRSPRPTAASPGQGPKPAPGHKPTVRAATLDEFRQAAGVAHLAATHGMAALSMRTIREVLQGGPPVQISGVSPGSSSTATTVDSQVEAQLQALDEQWLRAKAPAGEIYAVLVAIVLPAGRPNDIFLYAPTLSGATSNPDPDALDTSYGPTGRRRVDMPRSVSHILARWAVAAGKADHLKQLIEARLSKPMATVPGHVLLVQLGLESRNLPLAAANLDALAQCLQRDKKPLTGRLALHAALPALYVPTTQAAAQPVLERAMVDAKALGSPQTVMRYVEALVRPEHTRDAAIGLFRKLWQATPTERTRLVDRLRDDELWQLPEIYEFAHGAVFPPEGIASVSPWTGANHFSRLFQVVGRQNRFPQLHADASAVLHKWPEWTAGEALLAVAGARLGQYEPARDHLHKVLQAKAAPMTAPVRWALLRELEAFPALQEEVLHIYEDGIPDALADTRRRYRSNPVQRLVRLYQRCGRFEQARDLLVKFAQADRARGINSDAAYATYQHLIELTQVARELINLGFPVEAARIYQEIVNQPDRIRQAQAYLGSSNSFTERLERDVMSGTSRGWKAATLPAALRALLQTRKSPSERGPYLDLELLAAPQDMRQIALLSPLSAALQAAADPKLWAETQARLADLVRDNPKSLSVRTAAALAAGMNGKAEAQATAVRELARLVAETPLPERPEDGKAKPSRSRADLEQASLWLVARTCLNTESLRGPGEQLARRALTAARRLADKRYALAILREWGHLELQRGDRTAVERRWLDMFELVRPRQAGDRRDAPAQLAVEAPPGAAASNRTPPTREQFRQAAQIAHLATEAGLHPLALRVIRESLRDGPPATPFDSQRSDTGDRVNQDVNALLGGLIADWQRAGVPARDVYETLAAVVLPEGRSEEVHLYPRFAGETEASSRYRVSGLLYAGDLGVESVGMNLVHQAIRAERADDLCRRIAARENQRGAVLPAHVLLAQLAVAGRDRQGAIAALDWIGQFLRNADAAEAGQLAYHAALPALPRAELADQALSVLTRAVERLERSGAAALAGSLHLKLARFHFARHAPADAGRHLQALLRVLTPRREPDDSSDDYSSQEKYNYEIVAEEYAQGGQLEDTLTALGQFVDVPGSSSDAAQLPGSRAAIALVRLLGARPARERYELLKAWTLPTPIRPTVRLFGAFLPPDAPPAFQGPAAPAPTGVVSSAALLLDAARAAGQLDKLAEEVRRLAAEQVENAQVLLVLTEIARGKGAAVRGQFDELADGVPARWDFRSSRPRPNPWPDFLVVQAGLQEPALRDGAAHMAQELLSFFPTYRGSPFPSYLERAAEADTLGAEGQKALAALGDTPPALWRPADAHDSYPAAAGPPAVWAAYDGQLRRWGGQGHDRLVFAYPLTGSFDFSADVHAQGPFWAALEYGGIPFPIPPNDPRSRPSPDDDNEDDPYGNYADYSGTNSRYDDTPGSTAILLRPFIRPNAFNRLTLQVRPDKVRWLINGRLVREVAGFPFANPWLALRGKPAPGIVFRNLQLTGTPNLPAEVHLSQSDRLDGWISSFYGETQPLPLHLPPEEPNDSSVSSDPSEPVELDWTAHHDEIRGRRSMALTGGTVLPSRLMYERPLWPGETLRYEFYYEPDAVMVHPALGRLAFLLEPNGVRVHWMVQSLDGTGLKPDNAVSEPGHRRGPVPLPLKPKAWNDLRLTLRANTVGVELNGTPIYERELEASNDRVFSLFHFKDRTAAQVRHVVLQGNWPRTFSPKQAANLTAPVPSGKGNDSSAGPALIGEQFLALDAAPVLRQAHGLPAAERYRLLRAWVIPDDARRTFRLHGVLSSGQPAGATTSRDAMARTRLALGGHLESPAQALVATAKDSGRLDELIQEVNRHGQHDPRGRYALLVLIHLARQHDDAAKEALDQLRPLAAKVPWDAPEWTRWPELAAAASSLHRPPLHGAALALLETMAARFVKFPVSTPLDFFTTQQLELARLLKMPGAESVAPGAGLGLAYWSPAPHATASTRGLGYPLARWTAVNGEVWCYPGRGEGTLYLAAPLRGDFEVRAELTPGTRIAYAGHWFGLHPQGKRYTVNSFGQPRRSGPLPSTPGQAGPWNHFRFVVQKQTFTAFVNGTKIHEAPLLPETDPWFMIGTTGWNASGVRGLTILGSPTVPESLSLSSPMNLEGWWATYYDEKTSSAPQHWEKRGDELIGQRIKESAGRQQESLLQYHRPLREDGQLAYEFYYEPGIALAHPALDRLVFLLDPEGVKIHWLTNAQFDSTGPTAANATVEPANRRGPASLPLKERAWNRLKLILSRDKVTLDLNGETVYERELEPDNQRTFGLFHYGGESEARVRGVQYQGHWSRQIPTGQDLLARPKPKAD